jgi:cytochrome P450
LSKVLSDIEDGHVGEEYGDSFVRRCVESTQSCDWQTPPLNADRHLSAAGACDLDRKELIYTMRDLLAGGTETGATIIRWFLLEMANNSDVQRRMREEVDAVVGTDCHPSLADQSLMVYTQAVILETLRRHTVAPLAIFHATTRDTRVYDFFIPEKTLVSSTKSAVTIL